MFVRIDQCLTAIDGAAWVDSAAVSAVYRVDWSKTRIIVGGTHIDTKIAPQDVLKLLESQ